MKVKTNIILFGGQLFNKGAQAMTFIAVDEMTKRFPDHNIVLLSTKDYQRNNLEKENYQFSILPNPRCRLLLISALSRKVKFLKEIVKDKEEKKIVETLREMDYVLDISGYALGSDWGCDGSIDYCLRVKLAKMSGAKVYLMPQSFGPFNFKGKKANLTKRIIRRYLPLANLIMARETESYNTLKTEFGLTNIVQSFDMVLQNKGINIKNVYKKQQTSNIPEIKENSIGIIPNMKTIKFGDKSVVFQLYDVIVDVLKNYHKNIYFMIHSSEDREICINLYNRYKERYDEVFYLDYDMSCLEFDSTVKKFDFVIASRYHAVVHAFRNKVPAIVLGWALKYQELMRLFDQEKYHFSVRDVIDLTQLKSMVIRMIEQSKEERLKIEQGLNEVQKHNAFDYIK